MPQRLSSDRTFQFLEDVLRVTRNRHNVIAGNISNLDTPGYRSRDIDFKSALDRALHADLSPRLETTDPGHISLSSGASGEGRKVDAGEEFNGVNWVDIDEEMKKLTENRLMYRTAIEILMRKMATLRAVIEGGR